MLRCKYKHAEQTQMIHLFIRVERGKDRSDFERRFIVWSMKDCSTDCSFSRDSDVCKIHYYKVLDMVNNSGHLMTVKVVHIMICKDKTDNGQRKYR